MIPAGFLRCVVFAILNLIIPKTVKNKIVETVSNFV